MQRRAFAVVSVCTLLGTAQAQDPDLLIEAIDRTAVIGDWQGLTITGTAQVDVTNQNIVPAVGPFDVVLFEDTNGNGAWDSGTDLEFGRATVAGIAASTTTTVPVSVSGPVRFRDDLMHGIADVDNVVTESDESNNLYDTGFACGFQPGSGFPPTLEWSWTSSPNVPTSLNVLMTPGIIDLNGDQVPDVVFGSTASTSPGLLVLGVLRALSGADGTELFTNSTPGERINAASGIAVGDIDGDNLPEIVCTDQTGDALIAFENDGTFKWRSPALEPIRWGQPAIADLNQDGSPEIVVGRQAVDNAGNILWTGTGGGATGPSGLGTVSVVADIDLDGSPEVVTGNTVYSNAGVIESSNGLADGFPAVANFDADPAAEVVSVSSGTVYLLDTNLSTIWSAALPDGGIGGPPTVADYDNDGQPEIGVASSFSYNVWETNGSLLWSQPTQDNTSQITGSSVFDFDGDGSAEVVYRDELKLRVYRGTDGFVLWEVDMSSCTWLEYVLVADVDADANAEIIAVANQNCGFGPQQGVFVYGASQDNWVPTRQIWNQHSYHVTNINDDGTIPTVENNNWQTPPGKPFNNYRQNVLSTGNPTAAPDLTASWVRGSPSGTCPQIEARIGNGGSIFTAAGLPVSFYDGDPNAGGTLLGTVLTSTTLQPGDFEDVVWPVPPATSFASSIYVVADDDGTGTGTENECDEVNNVHSAPVSFPIATWTTYGTGFPGTLGTPLLVADAIPSVGTGINLLVDNSSGVNNTHACLFVGTSRANVPTSLGGNILVNTIVVFGLNLSPGTNVIPINIDCSVPWGVVLDLQAIEVDAGAFRGVSFSNGLELVIGI